MRKSLRKKAMLAVPAATLGLLFANAARADVTIFGADFESDQNYATGTLPAGATAAPYTGSSGGLYPDTAGNGVYSAANTGGETGWDQLGFNGPGNDGYANDAYVIANPNTTASPSSGVANTSANVAAFIGDSSGGTVHSSTVGATLGVLAGSVIPKTITVSQSAYYSSTVGNSDSRSLIIGGGLVNLSFGEGGYFNTYGKHDNGNLVWDFNGSVDSTVLTTDAWHTAAVVIHLNAADLADSTADFSVDGTTVEDGIAYDASSLANTSVSYFAYTDDFPDTNSTGDVLLDNVSITESVPEPASLALLGFGGVLLMRRRRNTRRPALVSE